MFKKYWRLHLVLLALVGLWGCMSYYVEPLGLPAGQHYAVRGKELAEGLAACGFCHGNKPRPGASLVGGRVFYDLYGATYAANITPAQTGIGAWETKSFLNYFRQFKGLDGEFRAPEFHRGFEWLSDRDLYSLVAYLATVTPFEREVPQRKLGWWDRNYTGFWEGDIAVWGVVPEVESKESIAHGRYLLENVARCSSCHNGVAGWFTSAPYLEGRELEFADGVIEAPALVGKKSASAWPEKEIVKYLKTGITPSGKVADVTSCPVEFYANAAESDLRSIAKYLNSLVVVK